MNSVGSDSGRQRDGSEDREEAASAIVTDDADESAPAMREAAAALMPARSA